MCLGSYRWKGACCAQLQIIDVSREAMDERSRKREGKRVCVRREERGEGREREADEKKHRSF